MDGGRVLVTRRRAGAHLGGLWEFPGGRVEAGESPAGAARRELAEETGLVAERLVPLAVVVHAYPGRSVRLHAFLAPGPRGRVRLDGPREWAWVEPRELAGLPMPEANASILRALEHRG